LPVGPRDRYLAAQVKRQVLPIVVGDSSSLAGLPSGSVAMAVFVHPEEMGFSRIAHRG